MSQLIYLDFLRRVSPVQNEEIGKKPDEEDEKKREFLLLGSFDSVSVSFEASDLYTIKKLHEKGHETVASVYDRQPMYLYDYNDGKYESPECIFATEGEFAHLPIIISILQINKTEYAQSENASISDLIGCVRAIVEDKIKLLSSDEQDKIRHWAVYWNFGEPDAVIVFRPRSLAPVASILHNIRVDNNDELCVFSSCSHCGFPCQKDNKNETENALKEWLQEETSSDKTEFFSLVNTSSGYHNLNAGRFVFGEWDYIINQDPNNELAGNLLQSEEYRKNVPYKTSYTLPAITLNNLGTANGAQLSDDDNWVKDIQSSFEVFLDSIQGMPYVIKNSIELIRSLSHTLTGLAKYLIRLYLGRYEQDLYTYTKPVFVALPLIINSYQKQIVYLHNDLTLPQDKKGDIICRLIKEFEEDATNLISGLQHLFSVLSISPHTFMETFGSNMRSLSAANKLVDAYQGLISFLGCYFPDVIDEKTTGKHNILIIPFRKSYPKHTLFFHSSSPLVRISKIEMDFPKMFRLGPSVYTILHECAHHLGNRFRLERWQEYSKACACFAVESIVSKYLIDPVITLISSTRTKNLENIKDAPLFYGMEGDPDAKEAMIALFNQSIFTSAKDAIIKVGEKLYKIVDEYMGKTRNDLKPDYSPYFQNQMYNDYSLNLIENTYSELFSNDNYNAEDGIRSRLLEAIDSIWIEAMRDRAQRIADYVILNGGNQYEASLLVAKYKNGNIAAELAKNAPSVIQQKILVGGFRDLLYVFSDIYADIFAIRTLNIPSFTRYCELVLLTGTAVNEAIVNSRNLQRLAVVGKTCFGIDPNNTQDGFDELIKANNNMPWNTGKIRKEWRKAKRTSYFKYISNYADECKKQMDDHLASLQQNEDISAYLTILKDTFNNDGLKTETAFIETFWKFLMKGEGC